MEKVRVLIVDDAVLARKVIADSLSDDPTIEVVGTASNGRLALQRLDSTPPDVLILDFEMPEMDGLATIDAVRQRFPKLPIVMCSAFTNEGAAQTLEALARGANDYVAKPSRTRNIEEAKSILRRDLVPKIHALCGIEAEKAVEAAPSRGTGAVPRVSIDVIAIGSSTGGPNALAAVLPELSERFALPILITQHMPKVFTALLANRLASQSKIKVIEAAPGMRPVAGHAYIAPGGFHLIARRADDGVVLDLTEEAPENSCRPSVDVMLRSVVDVYGEHVLAVILTGMGQDGLRGCELVRRAGGIVLAQDKPTSVVWGMPGAVTEAGVAHAVAPISDIAPMIERIVTANKVLRGKSKRSEESKS